MIEVWNESVRWLIAINADFEIYTKMSKLSKFKLDNSEGVIA